MSEATKKNLPQIWAKWRKTKLQSDGNIYKNLLSKYNKEMKKNLDSAYISQIITEYFNNSKFLFNTSDKLVNPLRPTSAELHSSNKCDVFALYF